MGLSAVALWLWWGMASAWAADDPVACTVERAAPPEALSVAWVSPLGKRVGRNGWLTLVPTTELKAFVQGEGRGSVARLLQFVGRRKRSKEPNRRWKVVVFDVRAEQLCRPMLDREGGLEAFGMVSCPERVARFREANDGCGALEDRSDGGEGPAVYRARWRDVVRNGFCVLPAERFVGREDR